MGHHGIDVLFKRLSSGLAYESRNFEKRTEGRRELVKKSERGRLPFTIYADVSPKYVTINIFRVLNGWECLASVFCTHPRAQQWNTLLTTCTY